MPISAARGFQHRPRRQRRQAVAARFLFPPQVLTNGVKIEFELPRMGLSDLPDFLDNGVLHRSVSQQFVGRTDYRALIPVPPNDESDFVFHLRVVPRCEQSIHFLVRSN
jgi:hypothetical protein